MGKWGRGGDTGIKIRRHQIRSLGSKGNFKACRRCRRHRPHHPHRRRSHRFFFLFFFFLIARCGGALLKPQNMREDRGRGHIFAFKARLLCIVSSRITNATKKGYVSKHTGGVFVCLFFVFTVLII